MSTTSQSDGEDSEIEATAGLSRRPRGSLSSLKSDDSDQAGPGTIRGSFIDDATTSVLESIQHGDHPDNIQLELNALRMGSNASEHDVRRALVGAFVARIIGLMTDEGLKPKVAVERTFKGHDGLLSRAVFDRDDQARGQVNVKGDQVDLLLLFQEIVSRRRPSDGDSILLHVSNHLFLAGVIELRGFEQWWNDPRSVGNERLVSLRRLMGKFMEVILEDDEDEEEEDEDDGDGDCDGDCDDDGDDDGDESE